MFRPLRSKVFQKKCYNLYKIYFTDDSQPKFSWFFFLILGFWKDDFLHSSPYNRVLEYQMRSVQWQLGMRDLLSSILISHVYK